MSQIHQEQSGQRIHIENNYGEKLVGVLHESGSAEMVILCHGFRASKEDHTLVKLADALTKEGITIFRFDFSGNGESEGSFVYGNFDKEVEDLRAVVQYFSGLNRVICAAVGLSKGANEVLLYASRYNDVPIIVNIAGLYHISKKNEYILGENLQMLKEIGYIDVKDEHGNVLYQVTEKSLRDFLSTDMHTAAISIHKNCRVLTVHGTEDEMIPVDNAFEFAKLIQNHKLHIIEGADHGFNNHQAELDKVVLDFIKEPLALVN